MKNLKISTKLMMTLLLTGIIPFLVIGVISLVISERALTSQAFHQLELVAEIKRDQLQTTIGQLKANLETAAIQGVLIDSFIELEAIAEDEDIGIKHADFDEAYEDLQVNIKPYQGLADDFYLITKSGLIVYSSNGNNDFKADLVNGPLKNSGLAKAYAGALENKATFADFSAYSPVDNRAVSFMAAPIHQGDESVAGVVVYQIGSDFFDGIMSIKNSSGKASADVFLIGEDHLFRSSSQEHPDEYTVQASFKNPDSVRLDTIHVEKGLAGESGQSILVSLGGQSVLSSYSALDLMGNQWVILAEIDAHDALEPVHQLEVIIGLVAAFSVVIIILAAFMYARSFTRPITKAADIAKRISTGDLTVEIETDRGDEIGQLMNAMKIVVTELHKTITSVASSVGELSTSATELSSISDETNRSVKVQKEQTESVAAAIEELTATSKNVAENSSNAETAASEAEAQAKSGKSVVNSVQSSINSLAQEIEKAVAANQELEQYSIDIGSILDVIRGIAEQTNLLALNAAIEAARAGDQGRGFAVVADEVRGLAGRTQESTEEIQQMIEKLQTQSKNVVEIMVKGKKNTEVSVDKAVNASESLDSIIEAIDVIKSMSTQIAVAAEQQTTVASEINGNVINIAEIADNAFEGASKSTSASKAMENLSEKLNSQVLTFKL